MNVTSRILGSLGLTVFMLVGCGTIVVEPVNHAPAGLDGNSTSGSGAGGSGPCASFDAGAPRTGPDKRVVDMTGADAHDWCENYVFHMYPNASISSPPMPPQGPPSPPGYINGYAAEACWELVPGGGCLTRPTVDDCVTNLMHAPCEATIVSLDDCVGSFFNIQGQCTPVGQGCTVFEQAPNCDETVVMRVTEQPANPNDVNPTCLLRLAPECGY